MKVVDAFAFQEHKSKAVREALNRLEATKTVLVVELGENRNLTLGIRNLAGVTLMASREVNVYELLKHDKVLLSQAAASKLSEALSL